MIFSGHSIAGKNGLNSLLDGFLDILFPPGCGACGQSLEPGDKGQLCGECLSQVKFMSSPSCCCCGADLRTEAGVEDRFCLSCLQKQPVFNSARSLAHYQSPVSDLLHRLKFNSDTAAAFSLAWLAKRREDQRRFTGYDLIIPVPLHRTRLQERGLNQSLILAKLIFTDDINKIEPSLLIRTKNTQAQTGLSGSERRKNLRGAFSVTSATDIKNKRICLVDDVFTTGTTVVECTRALKKAGAAEVAVWTLARA